MSPTTALLLVFFAGSAMAMPADGFVSDSGNFQLILRSSPTPIPLNELFEMEVDVRPVAKDAEPGELALTVEATMPVHQHGMTTVPQVTALGGGRFRIQGLLFHMAGEWRCEFGISQGSRMDRASATFHIE